MASEPFRVLIFLACLALITTDDRVSEFKTRAANKNKERFSLLTSVQSRVEEKLQELATTVRTELLTDSSIFYDYSIMCGADVDPASRVKQLGLALDTYYTNYPA
jgi:hypothetical protein